MLLQSAAAVAAMESSKHPTFLTTHGFVPKQLLATTAPAPAAPPDDAPHDGAPPPAPEPLQQPPLLHALPPLATKPSATTTASTLPPAPATPAPTPDAPQPATTTPAATTTKPLAAAAATPGAAPPGTTPPSPFRSHLAQATYPAGSYLAALQSGVGPGSQAGSDGGTRLLLRPPRVGTPQQHAQQQPAASPTTEAGWKGLLEISRTSGASGVLGCKVAVSVLCAQ